VCPFGRLAWFARLRARSNQIDAILRYNLLRYNEVQLPSMYVGFWMIRFFELEQIETLRFNLLGYREIISSRSHSPKAFPRPRELCRCFRIPPSLKFRERTRRSVGRLRSSLQLYNAFSQGATCNLYIPGVLGDVSHSALNSSWGL
jgi:hypothetical protein